MIKNIYINAFQDYNQKAHENRNFIGGKTWNKIHVDFHP